MRARPVLALLLLVGGAASCAQILGDDFEITEDDENDDNDSSSSNPTSSGGSCDTCNCGGDCCVACTACHCQAQANACNGSQDCIDYSECLSGCESTDQYCIGSCQSAYPQGAAIAATLISCWESYCYETCYLDSCGGGG